MTSPGRSAELIEDFYQALGSLDPEAWLSYFTDDAIFDQPFAPNPDYPTRLVGVDAIRNHVRSIDKVFGELNFTEVLVHATSDPDFFVATLCSSGSVLATGRRYANEYVALFRFAGQKVAHYREYFDPLRVLAAFGDGDELNSAFHIES
jgi:uncharacterized protein